MRLGVTLPVDDGLSAAEYVGIARVAEECGYDTMYAGETSGPEVFALLGLVAASTSRIRLGSGIVGSFTRSPALTAMGFATLASYAPGRIVAGIGASSPLIVEKWHGRSYSDPVGTTAEFVAVLREALAGGKVRHLGERVQVDGFRLGRAPETPVPVELAAMNPRMLRLAGSIADGAFLTWCPPDEVPAKVALVREGEAAAGRPPGEVGIVASFWAYAGPRPDDALERMRRFVLQYAMVPTHQPSFAGSIPRLTEAATAWHQGDRAAALRLVPDAAVHRMCAVGDGAAVAARARELAAAGVGLPVALVPGAAPGDAEGPKSTLRALAAGLPSRGDVAG